MGNPKRKDSVADAARCSRRICRTKRPYANPRGPWKWEKAKTARSLQKHRPSSPCDLGPRALVAEGNLHRDLKCMAGAESTRPRHINQPKHPRGKPSLRYSTGRIPRADLGGTQKRCFARPEKRELKTLRGPEGRLQTETNRHRCL